MTFFVKLYLSFIGQIAAKERRGKHLNRPHRISVEDYRLVDEHLKSIPHKQSHYSRQKTSRKYFVDPTLTIKKLFESFKEFYKEKTEKSVKFKYDTYYRYFHKKNEYFFRHPKSDVCDFCTTSKLKLAVNPDDSIKISYHDHIRKNEQYQNLKKQYIQQAQEPNSEILVVEFDYAQNFALPKLNVSAQFYKRLLWLYLFNIHCYNDDSSYF